MPLHRHSCTKLPNKLRWVLSKSLVPSYSESNIYYTTWASSVTYPRDYTIQSHQCIRLNKVWTHHLTWTGFPWSIHHLLWSCWFSSWSVFLPWGYQFNTSVESSICCNDRSNGIYWKDLLFLWSRTNSTGSTILNTFFKYSFLLYAVARCPTFPQCIHQRIRFTQ